MVVVVVVVVVVVGGSRRNGAGRGSCSSGYVVGNTIRPQSPF